MALMTDDFTLGQFFKIRPAAANNPADKRLAGEVDNIAFNRSNIALMKALADAGIYMIVFGELGIVQIVLRTPSENEQPVLAQVEINGDWQQSLLQDLYKLYHSKSGYGF